MNLQQVISSGKNYKRSSNDMWLKTVKGKVITTGAMLLYELNSDDILADDWEIEEDKPTELLIEDSEDDSISFELVEDDNIYVVTNEDKYRYAVGVYLKEKDIDIILTFLYNNTEIGKSRITPF
jgi:hypothetical protein